MLFTNLSFVLVYSDASAVFLVSLLYTLCSLSTDADDVIQDSYKNYFVIYIQHVELFNLSSYSFVIFRLSPAFTHHQGALTDNIGTC